MLKKIRCTFAPFSKRHCNNFNDIYSSMLVPPIWRNVLRSWIQEAVNSGYIKKRTLGWSVVVRDGSRGARMNLLSMYDRVSYYPTPNTSLTKGFSCLLFNDGHVYIYDPSPSPSVDSLDDIYDGHMITSTNMVQISGHLSYG